MKYTRQRQTRRKGDRRKGGRASLNIHYGNIRVSGQEIPIAATKTMPNMPIPPGHFVIMWDKNAMAGTYLHWLQGPKAAIISYEGPAPPPGTGTHHYVFRLIKGIPKMIPAKRAAVDVAAVIGSQPIIYEKEMTVSAKSK